MLKRSSNPELSVRCPEGSIAPFTRAKSRKKTSHPRFSASMPNLLRMLVFPQPPGAIKSERLGSFSVSNPTELRLSTSNLPSERLAKVRKRLMAKLNTSGESPASRSDNSCKRSSRRPWILPGEREWLSETTPASSRSIMARRARSGCVAKRRYSLVASSSRRRLAWLSLMEKKGARSCSESRTRTSLQCSRSARSHWSREGRPSLVRASAKVFRWGPGASPWGWEAEKKNLGSRLTSGGRLVAQLEMTFRRSFSSRLIEASLE